MAAKRRHVYTYCFLRHTAGPILRAIFRFQAEIVELPETPCLILSNHNTDLDPALVALSFPRHMYFLASEHVFRKGFGSWLLRTVFAPLSRMKGSTDAQAAMDVIRSIRRGNNICLFAEGNRSFSGVTGPIFPATGKLAKTSGASLVTYRITGGYLTTPRWSETRRKGKMRGECVHIYSPAQLKQMTPEEVNAHIAEDLAEDAFARQKAAPAAYRGRKLAAGLERALFICPRCGKIGTLHGEGDVFSCACGLSVRYTEYGFFEGGDAPFDCVRDWDRWQAQKLAELAADGTLSLCDGDMRLFAVNKRHRMRPVDGGRLCMNREELQLGNTRLALHDISNMAVVGAAKLMLTAAGRHYEIRARGNRVCGRKYFMLYEIYTQKG